MRSNHHRLLILNCIVAEEPRAGFDEGVAPRLGGLFGGEWDLAHLASTALLPEAEGYSYLILSGSELSAARENPRDEELCALIRDFVVRGRRVLGICYGEQMIARALCNTPCCRRAARPEFGWKRLALEPDPLFDGIAELVCVHSHYDEVHDLPPSFRVIASTDDCAVQAFAYQDRPVWGVQFHPELDFGRGQAMLEDNLRTEEAAAAVFANELEDVRVLQNNARLFKNFFRADAGR